MATQDWDQFGEDIRQTVQNAVDSQDFSQLNQTVSNKVNQILFNTSQSVKYTVDSLTRGQNPNQYTYQNTNQYTNQRTTSPVTKNPYSSTQYPSRTAKPMFYGSVGPVKFGGYALSTIGGITTFGGAVGLISTLITTAIGGAFSLAPIVGSVLAGSCAVAGAAMIGVGCNLINKVKRFRTYIKQLGNREYCDLDVLSGAVRKSEKFVAKDIQNMINKRWFLQGHIDEQKTCFMVSDLMYEQYLQTIDQKRIQDMEAKKRQDEMNSAQVDADGLTPEVRGIIEKGNEYILKIRACNDAIPGVEISEKIDKIEKVVNRIFERVKQKPECVNDIRKLMEYYLPTTVKLLESYEQMDSEPAGGANIQAAKKEIEATLDTLNVAFEKLLDDLFQDTAWDISADISVLHTMLAQEGLTEDGLKKMKK